MNVNKPVGRRGNQRKNHSIRFRTGQLDLDKLTDRVLIQSKIKTKDGHGQKIESWDEGFWLWGNMLFLNGKEQAMSGVDIAKVTGSLRILMRKGMNTDMRIVYDGVPYEIKAVLPNKGGGFMDLAFEGGVTVG